MFFLNLHYTFITHNGPKTNKQRPKSNKQQVNTNEQRAVSPVFKKGNHNDKTNYRSVSILPSLSKIYERLIYNEINQMTENTLSIFHCGFRKKYSTQHALIAMIEKAKKILDKAETFGALLTDLSKVFDCMTHDLLIAKLHALNFDMNAHNLIFDYLTGRKQRVKINSSFSSYLDIFQGVPQEPILGPSLFNLFLCDLFLFVEEVDIMSYVDDNTPYVCSENVDVTLEKLEEVGKYFLNGFQTISERQMLTNVISF